MTALLSNSRLFSNSLGWLGAGAIVVTLVFLARCIYLLYFHPLAKYPGPWYAAISDTYYAYHLVSSDGEKRLEALHQKYGDIVRIAPNDLFFASEASWDDIYSIPTSGRKQFLKTGFYGVPGAAPTIFTAKDPREHSRQRRMLAHAFSNTALQSQELVIHKYVDLFLQLVGKLGAPGGQGVNLTEAYNWLTFDIIGDLTFSESFDAVAQARTHPWVKLISEAGPFIVVADALKRAPLIALYLSHFTPKNPKKRYTEHAALTREKTRKRIELGAVAGRDDFFAEILSKNTPPIEEMEQQSIEFIVAGSETTSTALTAQTYFLLRNPECLERLQNEVRSAFKSVNEITGKSTAQMSYLLGVVEEGLRLFPPLVLNAPRYSPGAMIDGNFIPAGVIVSTNTWTPARDPRYWYEPEKFLPERWIGDGFGDKRQASRPFLLGPHRCIGINLAYIEMRVTLAKMIFVYDIELAPSCRDMDFVEEASFQTLWRKPELKVIFNPRIDKAGM